MLGSIFNAGAGTSNVNVGIGTSTPAVSLDVKGTTSTNALQVGSGTVHTKVISGTTVVGANGTGQKVVTIGFGTTFASSTPRVFVTPRNQTGTTYLDTFSVTIQSVTSTGVTLNIQRTDANVAWAQLLNIDWFVVE